MDASEIPAELKDILDTAAGRKHSAEGSVMRSLAAILTRYHEMIINGELQTVPQASPLPTAKEPQVP